MAWGYKMIDKTLVLTPRMSEKAYSFSQSGGSTYVFDVPKDANKHTIARAICAQYPVTVAKVTTATIKGKAKRTVRKSGRAAIGRQSDVKKAYVTLKAGDKLSIFAAIEQEQVKAEKNEQALAKAAEKAAKKEKK